VTKLVYFSAQKRTVNKNKLKMATKNHSSFPCRLKVDLINGVKGAVNG